MAIRILPVLGGYDHDHFGDAGLVQAQEMVVNL